MNYFMLVIRAVVVTAVLAHSLASCAFSQFCNDTEQISIQEWREDLAILRERMPREHGNLFHTMTREQFNGAVDRLEANLQAMSDNQIKVAVMKLVAMVNDGHTRVRFDTFGDHMLPIRVYFFADGLYVISGASPCSALVGGKVIRIGRLSTNEAYRAVRELVPIDKENELRRRLLSADLLVTTEVLHAIGATPDASSVEIVVEKEGKQVRMSLPCDPFRAWNNHGWPRDPEGWVDARSASRNPIPIWLMHTDKNYWSEVLPDGKTLYIQFNNVEDDPKGEPIARYFPNVIRRAEQRGLNRIILDLRLNGGGDNSLIRPIWHSFLKSDRFNQKGKLWVLIGPKTFSAATSLVDELELNTNALFAGEPTGEAPNQWGDPADIRLPNSGIDIQVSTLWWQFEDPRDSRAFRTPDRLVELTHSDFMNNSDPVLNSIVGK